MTSSVKHRILFKGYYNVHNFGDDLLFLALLDFFQNRLGWERGDITVYVEPGEGSLEKLGYSHPYQLNNYLDPVKECHARLKKTGLPAAIVKLLMSAYMLWCLFCALVYKMCRLQLGNRKNIQFFKSLDVIHYIGGGYFNTRLTWGTQLLIYELFFTTMGKLINPKLQIIGTGLGIGPVTTSFYRNLFKHFAKHFDFIFVREKESEAFVRSLGTARHVRCIGDDVVLLRPYFQQIAKEVDSKKHVGLNLKFDDVHQYGSVQSFFEKLVQDCEASNREIRFFNFGRDHKALRQLPRELVKRLPIESCYETGLRHFARRLAESEKGLGFAYHFAILCALMDVPSANIYFDDYYRQKTGGVMSLLCKRHVTLP
ncbi:MAG TPA: polysaccharide pyruvyl transferase family protein, partial [Oculatellaceae cyanobacterium]